MAGLFSPAETSKHNHELFRKLLIPEIFSAILQHLTAKDRLNMRLCCHDTEEAVARSDMHITGSPSVISLTDATCELKLHLGSKKCRATLRLGKHIDDCDLGEVARVRERLFTRVFTKYLEVHVKFVQFALIARILEGCVFEKLDMIISCPDALAGVSEFLSGLDSMRHQNVKLSLPNAYDNDDFLLSLKQLRELEIREKARYLSEDVLVEMVKRKHGRLHIPVIVATQQTIDEVKKVIEANRDPQVVKFVVRALAVERYLLQLGYVVTRDEDKWKPFKEISKIRKAERPILKADPPEEAEKREEVKLKTRKGSNFKWTGDFDVDFGRVHILAKTGCLQSTYTFQVSNFHREKEDIDDSSDDERTTYF